MKTRFNNFFFILKTAFKHWWSKDPFKESAVIAYYAIFSLPGLLMVIITVAGYFLGQEAVNGHIKTQITTAMGAETAQQIQNIIVKASLSKKTVWATIIGLSTILIGATGVFVQFQKSLNTIWELELNPSKSGVLSVIKERLFSFGFIVAVAFILMVSLVVSAVLAAFGNWLVHYFSESLLIILLVLNFIFSLSTLMFLFACMFKFFPNAKIKWRHVWLGSFVTALLFEIGKSAMGLYFGKAQPDSGYGEAGSIILIMLWVSYSSMLVFFGAEFTHTYAELKEGTIQLDKNGKKLN